ncbi:hypothetical protein ORJ04_16745 [Rheinheimera baltica]|uniref:Uncharacterized protein n=1 Tax=Rheinheimera baltica TaxID=67576 RepID=A0ABT9I2I8_9GAMM|nr:hypothetical protein [Rheinheimera baltica]MDP5137606.1 hypothetical protein [Rheinheimera baltica]MDP5150968.1 hypothetical protein [Rheinheimera baltica]
MTNVDLTTQLQKISGLLQPYQFGIGGSCLLWRLGLETEPKDIDIVCTEQDFKAIFQVLSAEFQQQYSPAHPQYVSAHFARFSRAGWPDIELMAGIAVKRNNAIVSWTFKSQRCHWQDDICWMPPADWLQLYQLFDRPQRVAQLRRYLVRLRLNSLS